MLSKQNDLHLIPIIEGSICNQSFFTKVKTLYATKIFDQVGNTA